jgi:hypothetical protein
MLMLPHYHNATAGPSWHRLLVVVVAQDSPVTEGSKSHLESAQKTTVAGAN